MSSSAPGSSSLNVPNPTLADRAKFELFLAYLSDFKIPSEAKRKLAGRLLDHKGLKDFVKGKGLSQDDFKDGFVSASDPRAYLRQYLKVISFATEAQLAEGVASSDNFDEIVKRIKKYVVDKGFNLLAEHQASVKSYLKRLISCLKTLREDPNIVQDTEFKTGFLLRKQIEIIQELVDDLSRENLGRKEKETLLKLAFDQTALSYRIFETIAKLLNKTNLQRAQLDAFLADHNSFWV